MKRLLHMLVPVALIVCLLLTASCAAKETPKAALPEDGGVFGELNWGDSYNVYLDNISPVEIVRRSYEFAGYTGSAYYCFDADGKLASGTYRFNENDFLTWNDIAQMYSDLRQALTDTYGEPTVSTGTDLVAAGEGTSMDMWNIENGESRLSVVLSLEPTHAVTISYTPM